MVYSFDNDCLRFLWIGNHFRRIFHIGSASFLAHLHFNLFTSSLIQVTFVAHGKNVKLKLLRLSPCEKYRKLMVLKSQPKITISIDTVQLWRLFCEIFLSYHNYQLDLPFLVFGFVCVLQTDQTIQSKSKQDRKVFQRHSSEANKLFWPDMAISIYHNDLGLFYSVPQLWWTYCRNETEPGFVYSFICDFISLAGIRNDLHLQSASED